MIALALLLQAVVLAADAAPFPASPLEIVIQRGHGRNVIEIGAIGAESSPEALTGDGDDIRVWSRRAGPLSEWTLRRVFPGAIGFHLAKMNQAGTRDIVLIMSAHGAEMFRAGEWATPVLGPRDGLPPIAADSLYIGPQDAEGSEKWFGLFVQERGDSDGDGHPGEWRSFVSEDGVRWARAPLPNGPQRVTRAVRITKSTFAVRGDGSGGSWSVVRFDGRSWVPEPIEGMPELVGDVMAGRDGFLVEVTGADEEKTKSLFVRTPGRSWKPIRMVLPLGDRTFSFVYAPGNGFLGIRWSDAKGDEAREWSWFRMGEVGGVQSLAEAIPGAPGKVFSAAWALDGKAVLLRAAGARLGLRDDPKLFIQDGARGWRLASDILPGCGPIPTAIKGFAGDRGLGVLEAPPAKAPDDKVGSVPSWRWYLRDLEGTWRRLDSVLPTLDEDVIDSISDDPDHVLAVKVPSEGGPRWRWFIQGSEGWRPAEDYLPGSGSIHLLKGRWADGILGAEDVGGTLRWYERSENGTWTDLRPMIGPVAADARLGKALPAIRGVNPLGDHALELETMSGGAPLRLRRGKAGIWDPVEASEKARDSFSTGAGDIISFRGPAGDEFHLRRDDGSWVPLKEVIPSLRGKVRAAYRFLGRRGLAVQFDVESAPNRDTPWRYFYRSDRGVWMDLHHAVPGAPPWALVVYSLGEDDGLVILEAGDASGNGRPGEWFTFFRDGKTWKGLHTLLPGVATSTAGVRSFAGGAGLEVDPDGSWSAQPARYLRDSRGRFRPLAKAVPGSPTSYTALESFWGSRGLAFRVDGEGDVDREVWAFFVRPSGGTWTRLEVPSPPARIRAIQGDERVGILSLQGSDGEWTLYGRTGHGKLIPLRNMQPRLPPHVAEVRFFPEDGRAALRAATEPGRLERWTWLVGTRGGGFALAGETGDPTWIGVDWVRRGDGVTIAGATHVFDGQPVEYVPRPEAWFHREAGRDGAGRSYRAPSLVPSELEQLGSGPQGLVALYRMGGRFFAVAVSSGTLEVARLSVKVMGSPVGELLVLRNRLPDGRSRLYRMDDPTRAIWFYEDRAPKARPELTDGVFYDDSGHFYAATDRLAEAISFRRGNELLGFDQLAAVLFRPDRLEERLGLGPDEHLFDLSPADRAALRKARAGAEGGGLDLSSVEPPRLTLGSPPAQVSEPVVRVPVSARLQVKDGARVLARVLGVTSGATARPVPSRPVGGAPESLPFLADAGTLELPLLDGVNTVEVTVRDARDLATTRRFRVKYAPARPVKNDLYVAIVAPTRYRDGDFDAVKEATADAAAVARAFEGQRGLGYGEVRVKVFCDPAEAYPDLRCEETTLDKIREGVNAHFKGLRPGDTAVLYFTAHGDHTQQGRYYLLPGDGLSSQPSTVLDFDQVRKLLLTPEIPGRRMLVLNTCRAGAIARAGEEKRMLQQAAERDALYVLAATAADEYAYAIRGMGITIFSQAMVQALGGRAARRQAEGSVYFSDLSAYLATEVPRVARLGGTLGPQVPLLPPVPPWLDYAVASPLPIRWTVALEVDSRSTAARSAASDVRWMRWRGIVESVPGVRVVDRGTPATCRVKVTKGSDGRERLQLERCGTATALDTVVAGDADAIGALACAFDGESPACRRGPRSIP